mgnify:CR=1 FL=1
MAISEFTATITAVKDGKVTFQKYKKSTEKGKKGEKDGDAVTLSVAEKAIIAKGKFMNNTFSFAVLTEFSAATLTLIEDTRQLLIGHSFLFNMWIY